MDSRIVFAQLRDALAHLYPANESARRVVDDAGLDARRIHFSAQALENWHAILGEAVQAEKVDALLQVVLAEYGTNADWLAAYGRYRYFIEQDGRLAALDPIDENITQTTIHGPIYTSGGDVVGRDKITIGTIVSNFFGTDSEAERKLRNRQAMLKLVNDIWVKGVLERSLYNQLLIDLDMEQRPEAVERPWGMVLETPAQADRLLPSGTKMVTVFAELNQSLLILGEPGSGKSTMLLELARDLITQATQNPTIPIPVLFNLSSWANKRPPIRQWLIDELREKYQIPKALAQAWVEHDELLLLLDGLDEVKREYREECIEALNEFQQSGKTLVPLALCSRTAEYEALTSKLKLNGSIVLHSLTPQQTDMFLARSGDKLSAVAHLLQYDAELQTLVQSPLTLSIFCLTYQDRTVADLAAVDGTKTHLPQLFDAYIMRMFQRPGKLLVALYPREKTLHWLVWLAARMVQYSQTEFLIERLQPGWLQGRKQIWSYRFILGLLYSMIIGMSLGLLVGIGVGLLVGSIVGMRAPVLYGLDDIKLTERIIFSWRTDRKELLAWLLGGVIMGLSIGTIIGLSVGQIVGMSVGLRGGLLFGLIMGLIVGLIDVFNKDNALQYIQPNQGIWQTARNTLLSALLGGLSSGLGGGLSDGLRGALLFGLIGGLFFGAIYGGEACIKHIALRGLLTFYNHAPLNYARFLDYCADRIFLRKVGGGYIFIHRLLMEHFASLTEEDIKRLAASIDRR